MKKHNDAFFLLNIVDALSDILFYTSCSEEQFLIEIMRQDAVARKFENLGESVKNLSARFCDDHPQIPWSHIARFRDVLSHHYFGVDQKAVWNIARNDAKEAYQSVTQLKEYADALNDFERNIRLPDKNKNRDIFEHRRPCFAVLKKTPDGKAVVADLVQDRKDL